MKRSHAVSRARSSTAARGISTLFCALVIGCGPKADPGATDATTGLTTSAGTSTSGTVDTTAASTGAPTMATIADSDPCGTGACGTGVDDPTCGAFICETDMIVCASGHGNRCRAFCDVFLQDCPDGEKCAAVITDGGGAWDGTRCVPVSGTDVAGDACTSESAADGLDSCVEGAMCWAVDMDGNGTCVALCMGSFDAPTCPNSGMCTISNEGSLNLCLPNCDPLLQDCAEGAACYPINDGFICAPDASGDSGKANDPCEFINVCEAGLLCAGPEFVGAGCPAGSMGCCTPFCEFPDGVCPNPDQQCVQWFDPAMLPEGDPQLAIGFCGVPQ
jgi:hypothetical protein